MDAADLLNQPDHGEIVLTANVNTNEERILAIEKISLPPVAFAIFASGNEIIGNKRRVIIGRCAAEFLLKTFFVRAAGPDEIEIIAFVHLNTGIVLRQFRLEFEEEPLLERVLERDAME
jgi:hypothetical protein